GGAERVAIVNETFAARFFPKGRAIGGLVAFPEIANVTSHEPRTIVGVVSDAIYRSLREPQLPALYEPLAQHDWPFPLAGISLSVRAAEGSPLPIGHRGRRGVQNSEHDMAESCRQVAEQDHE